MILGKSLKFSELQSQLLQHEDDNGQIAGLLLGLIEVIGNTSQVHALLEASCQPLETKRPLCKADVIMLYTL